MPYVWGAISSAGNDKDLARLFTNHVELCYLMRHTAPTEQSIELMGQKAVTYVLVLSWVIRMLSRTHVPKLPQRRATWFIPRIPIPSYARPQQRSLSSKAAKRGQPIRFEILQVPQGDSARYAAADAQVWTTRQHQYMGESP